MEIRSDYIPDEYIDGAEGKDQKNYQVTAKYSGGHWHASSEFSGGISRGIKTVADQNEALQSINTSETVVWGSLLPHDKPRVNQRPAGNYPNNYYLIEIDGGFPVGMTRNKDFDVELLKG